MNLELNIERLNKYLDEYISLERRKAIRTMYDDLGDKLYLAPASSIESYHNAFPGGYLDHILRVADFSLSTYNLWKQQGMDVSDFDVENLIFCALHHDLGKLGFPGSGDECYVPNDSEWHKNKLGQLYKVNEKNPFMLVQDQSLFLLQYYQIPVSWVEWITIRIHDGLYDDVNKPYYLSRSDHAKLRTNLPHILHQADLMAARHEYESWKSQKTSSPATSVPKSTNTFKKNNVSGAISRLAPSNDSDNSLTDAFNKLFPLT